MTTTCDIHDLASELDRLLPSQTEDGAGHVGHDRGSEWPRIGWRCEGGQRGEAVFSIHSDDVSAAIERLARMEDGELDESTPPGTPSLLGAAMDGLRVEWHI